LRRAQSGSLATKIPSDLTARGNFNHFFSPKRRASIHHAIVQLSEVGAYDVLTVVTIYQYLTDGSVQNPEVRNALRKYGIVKKHETSKVADSPSVYMIGDLFVVLVSPLSFPNVAANEARAIKSARELLPSHLSPFLFDIVAEARLNDGRTIVVMPRGIPLSNNRPIFALQKRRIKPVIFEWLRGLALEAAAPSEETCTEFQASLESLATMNNLPAAISNAARDGLARLSRGTFVPRHCPMHADLWKGNIIYGPDRSLKIIDWRGSRMDGYGIFDLVKFAQSFNIRAADFRSETRTHAYSLGIDVIDARTTLLAACGCISRNLGEFSLASFAAMTSSLFNFLEASMA
jgi:hypothetical protein